MRFFFILTTSNCVFGFLLFCFYNPWVCYPVGFATLFFPLDWVCNLLFRVDVGLFFFFFFLLDFSSNIFFGLKVEQINFWVFLILVEGVPNFFLRVNK